MRISVPAALAATLALAACDTPRTLSPDFGQAVRHNMAAQIINPVPAIADQQPEQDGQRAGAAWERYRSGTVHRPKSLGTSDVGKADAR